MAEDNTTDPVDQLGGMSTFLDPAKIEMDVYKPVKAPVNFDIRSLPGGNNVSNPTYAIKDGSAGSAPNFPVKSASQAARQGSDRNAALVGAMGARINSLEDKNQYAKVYSYDSGKDGAFKARYKAYGQETYDKVGFHPLMDNETWFNANTTGWDDFKRMATHSAWPLMSQGFMDPIKSYASFFGNGGDIMGDTGAAMNYEDYSDIGYSTKGGFSGFTTNLLQSAAYSVGILAEGAIEGALIGAAVGAAEGGLPAIPGAAVGGATGLLKGLFRLPGALAKMSQSVGKMALNLNKAANLSEAKNMFLGAGKSMGNFFNPLENTSQAAMQYVFNNPDDLSNLARTAKTAGAFWHDAKNLNMALSEGRLEGGMAENRVYDKLYNDHYNTFGEAPDDATQQKMREQAKDANLFNTTANSLLVYYSNKLVFPSITQAKFLKGAPKLGFGNVVGKVGDEFQLVYTPGKKAGDAVYTAEKISLGNALKGFTKPSIYGRVGLNYFKKNLMEGFQEVGQEALAKYTEDYYTKTYYDPAAKNFQYAMAAINSQLSTQGAETFLSGFAMGSILQAPSTIGKYLSVGYNKYYKNRDNYDEHVQNLESDVNKIKDSLNTMYKNGQYFFDPRLGNYVNQTLIGKSMSDPDKTKNEIKDDEFTAFTSAVITSLRTGTFDMFLNNFASYKQASPKDIEEAWNLEQGQGEKALLSIDKAITNAKIISNRYNEAKRKMKNLLNLSNYEENSEEYKQAQLFNEAYESGLFNLTFLQAAFDDNLGRLGSLYKMLGDIKALQNVSSTNITNLTDPNKLNRDIQMLQTEIEAAEGYADPSAVEQVKEKKLMLSAMTNFQSAQDELLKAFVSNELLKQRKAEMLAEDPSLNEDSVELQVVNELLDEYSNGETNPFLEYKESFRELLKTFAGSPEQVLELEKELLDKDGFDSLFAALLDTHIIKNENVSLSQYVNLLNDPQGFYEHIQRNFEWMKNLYNNKEQYYLDIINSEITNIQRNEILNTLANQGVYVDLDEFAAWVEDHNNLPSYFIDAPKSMVINESSILYQDYVKVFMDAANLEEQSPAKNKLDQKEILDGRINEINDERNEKLAQAKETYNVALKKAINYTEEELIQKQAELASQDVLLNEEKKKYLAEKELLEKSIKQIDSKNITEVQAVYAMALENGYISDEIYDSAVQVALANPETMQLAQSIVTKYDENESQEIRTAATFINVILKPLLQDRVAEIDEILSTSVAELPDPKSTKEFAIYQEQVEAINKKYDELIQNLKNNFAEKGVDIDAPKTVSTTTSYNDMPKDLRDILDPLFQEHLDFIEESPTLAEVDPNKYENIRKRWIETQGAVINDYNLAKKKEAEEAAKKLLEAPVLKFAPAKITSQTPGNVLTSLYDVLTKNLDAGSFVNSKGETVDLSPEEIENIKSDLAALEAYIDARAKAYTPKTIAENVINQIVKSVIDKQAELVDVFDENDVKIGRQFTDRSETDPLPIRATKVAEEVELALLQKDPFMFNRLEDGSIQKEFQRALTSEDIIDSERLNFFMTAFENKNYKSFRSKKKLTELRQSLERSFTEENLVKTVQRLAFQESTIAGNAIDALVRDYLTPAVTGSGFMEVTWNPEVMTKEAFDALFKPGSGIMSKLRQGVIDGEFQILSENVKVFDRALRENGVTGEMDLLAIDKDGNVFIIDIKTGKESNWKAFGSGAKNDKEVNYRAQQSIYRNLFYNMSGIMPVKIGLLPLAIETDIDGKVLSVNKASIVLENENTIELEYLPEVENYGITPIAPAETTVTEATGETAVPPVKIEKTIPPADLSKLSLQDNLNKPVIYNGKTGKLVVLDDGVFGVELDASDEVTNLQIILEALNADLVVETGEFGNPAQAAEIKKAISQIKADIADKSKSKKVIELTNNMLPVKDGSVLLSNVGLTPVTIIENIGQIVVVNNESIDAKFDSPSEKTATINGIKYTVNRNDLGEIVSLSYRTNDKAIADIEAETKDLSERIQKLRAKRNEVTVEDKKLLNSQIAQLQINIDQLNTKRSKLLDTNAERTVRGGNANNLIFALNKLPNSFQKGHQQKKAIDEKKELKEISNLSTSSVVASAIDEILMDQYPESLDRLIEQGITKVNSGDLLKITLWAEESITRLEQLGFTMLNSNEAVTDVSNQINAIRDLLNDLQIIKLNKSGKISKRQSKELKEIFGSERKQVPNRTSVPETQVTAGRPAETILRPATGAELKELVKKARTKDADILEGITKTKEKPVASELVSKINAAKTVQEVDDIVDKAIIDEAKNPGTVDVNSAVEAGTARKQELLTITSLDTIQKGEYLLSKKDMAGSPVGTIFVVSSLKDNGAYIKNLRTGEGETYTAEEVSQNFEKTTEEAQQMAGEIEITPIDTENAAESAANLADIEKDDELLNKLKEEAKGTSEDDLLNQLINNSNKC